MRVETKIGYEQLVREAVCHLASHLDDELDLHDLASRAFLSPFHFHRIFRGMVGETPGEFLRRLRLERAAWTLGMTRTSVGQIALDAGFESPEAFTRTFRSIYTKSPSEYRRTANERIQIASVNHIHFDPAGALPIFSPKDTGGKDMAVEILHVDTMRIGTVRHIGPYNQIGQAFHLLFQSAAPCGIFMMPGAACLAVYYNDPETTPAHELESDAAIVLPGSVATPPGLIEMTLPGGQFAKFRHLGPYENLGDSWARFMGEWLPNSGKRFSTTSTTFEIYINDPSRTPKEKLQTDLYIPIE